MGIACVTDSFEIILSRIKAIINSFDASASDFNKNENVIVHLQAAIGLFDSLVLNLSEEDAHLSSKYQMCSTVFELVFTFGIKLFEMSLRKHTSMNFSLLSACLDYIVDYLEKCGRFTSENKTQILAEKMSHIEELIEKILIPILNSKENTLFDQLVMSKLYSNSAVSTNESVQNSFKKIFTNNLSYLPTMLDVMPVNEESCILRKSPFAFLTSFLRLYILCFKLRMKMLDNKKFSLTHQFLNNSYLKSYLKAYIKDSSQAKDMAKNSYLLMKYENLFVYYCTKLAFAVFDFEVRHLPSLNLFVQLNKQAC